MNSITLTGNLTQDINNPSNGRIAYGQTDSGRTFYNNGLAVNAGYYDANRNWIDRTYFFNIVAYGGTAENLAKNYYKGDPVLVQGEMVLEPYQTQDGRKGVNYYVLVRTVERSSRKNPHREENVPTSQGVTTQEVNTQGVIPQGANTQGVNIQEVNQNIAPQAPNQGMGNGEDFVDIGATSFI